MLCTSWNFLETHDTNNFEFQTVIFAVQNDETSKDVNQQLISGIQQFLDAVEHNKNQMKHYSLITFDDKQVENVINTVDTSTFVAKFTEKLNAPTKLQGKNVKSLQSMGLASQISVYKPAIVFLFVNLATSIQQAQPIMEALSLGGIQVNVFFTKPTGFSGNLDYYRSSTTNTNGRYTWIAPADVSQLLVNYLPTTVFENALILDELVIDCRSEVKFTFPVESRIKWFTVIVRGLDANNNVRITDSDGNPLTPQVITSDQGSYVAVLDQTYAGGSKTLSVKTSNGQCGVQVRASSELHTEIGFTLDLHSDYPNERPTIVSAKNGSTYVTVKVGKSLMSTVDVLPSHVQLFKHDLRTGKDELLVEGDLISRDHDRCANQYISSLLNVPVGLYKINQTPLIVKVTGKEGDTENFKRLQLYFPEPIK